ncbi:hypothetical protein ATCC90586_011225 [Pythium insidiosum]|nr:hypothetical protein ATCC90586_011225 [Pythium insidiosum]
MNSPVNAIAIETDLRSTWPDWNRQTAAIQRFIRRDARGLRGMWGIQDMAFLDSNQPWVRKRSDSIPSLDRIPSSPSSPSRGNFKISDFKISDFYPKSSSLSIPQLVVLLVAIGTGLVRVFKLSVALLLALLSATSVVPRVAADDGCYEDALVCPNGVVLQRDPQLNCEFPPCPT